MRGLEVQTERRAGKGQEGNTTLQQGEGLGPAEQTRARSESPTDARDEVGRRTAKGLQVRMN